MMTTDQRIEIEQKILELRRLIQKLDGMYVSPWVNTSDEKPMVGHTVLVEWCGSVYLGMYQGEKWLVYANNTIEPFQDPDKWLAFPEP
jgi:hypothetical protein